MSDQHPSFIVEYEDKKCVLTPVARQDYTNCFFESGYVDGHPEDTFYIRLGREDKEPVIVMLRSDEAMALVWVLVGSLWSEKLSSTFGEPRLEFLEKEESNG